LGNTRMVRLNGLILPPFSNVPQRQEMAVRDLLEIIRNMGHWKALTIFSKHRKNPFITFSTLFIIWYAIWTSVNYVP
jgi:hypothetical protein